MEFKEYREPVKFRFDSAQRKNKVILYDSKRFPGKTSEWYFVRKNATTLNETHRCVKCREVNEKARRAKNEQSRQPGARIQVNQDFFKTNPDWPDGEHICNFEHNENCRTHVVWAGRALLKANSELRINPERPKTKFEQLITDISDGIGYSHLDIETRKLMIEVIQSSKNGFDSRRRSFARNNSLAVKRLKQQPQGLNEDQKEKILKFESHLKRRFNSYASHRSRLLYSGERIPETHVMTTDDEELIVDDDVQLPPIPSSSSNNIWNMAVVRHEVVDEVVDVEQQNFMSDVEAMLNDIRECARIASVDPHWRDAIFSKLSVTADYCASVANVETLIVVEDDGPWESVSSL
jgi:hypothetical protein